MNMRAQVEPDDEQKNSNFTQVYSLGWKRLRWLMAEKPTAAQLYTFLAENMDSDGGVLVASQEVLAEATGVSEITVRRLTKWLEDNHVIVRIRVGNGVYAYALNPNEVWKAWNTTKDHAVFRTKTLVKKRDRHNAQVARRIQTMMKEAAGEPELPGLDHDPETGEVT